MTNRRRTWIFAGIAVLLAGASAIPIAWDLLAPATPGLAWSDRSESLWVGIPARIRFALPAARAADGPSLAKAAFDDIRLTGAALNPFDPSSEVGRFNREGGQHPFVPSAELNDVLRLSQAAWRMTDGAFDVTVWPLKTLWKRAVKEGVPPAPDDVHGALAGIGLQRLAWSSEGAILPLNPPASLDFGGIIKGYAVDRAVALLKSRGAASGLVQVGGEIRAFGTSPDSRPWRVGVRDPLDEGGVEGVVMATGDLAISTSANYEQPVRVGGVDYYHIFDPRTGAPVDTRLLSVTVVLDQGEWPNAIADALSTGVAVLGPERGLALIESLPGAGALFVVRGDDGRAVETVSSRLAARYHHGAE